jgi:hypothetical protein
MIGDITVITVHDIYRLFTETSSRISQQERKHSTSEDSDIDESSQGQLKTDLSKGEVLFIC